MITNLHPNSCPAVVAPLTTKSAICNPWEQLRFVRFVQFVFKENIIRMVNPCLSARSVGE